ncbi:BLUF domain-containing protein [Phenylobacterium sp.]|uniref:BLUF domain-containing protein n=1 Tax=Phenylobacterium sp. TaxID=1871053 RepID=UPI00273663AE|nr:BLUF domain-containing protein [Phenylobacterium sp.]MDP3661023.1 BLUF domain-containing protein [Phenylobacterium sp.]
MTDEAQPQPTRSLHRLIYFSRQRLADDPPPNEQVEAIVRASIRNNREVAVTGLLLVHDGWFIQALEGPMTAVLTTYRRIIEDPRHEAPVVINAAPAASREFADWNMCARSLSAADEAIIDALEMRDAFEPTRLNERSALRLLKAVRDIQDRTALSAATR